MTFRAAGARASFRILTAGAVFAAAWPAAVPAQEAEQPDTIVVTSRLRSEALQDVPIAVTALDGAALTETARYNIQDIAEIVPTVTFRAGASNKDRTVFIRGVGTITTSPGVEPSVSTVLDGVVLTRPGQSTLDLVEVERLEVLRGPQGTLFGKNASAGVINIVTTSPTDHGEGYAEAAYFDEDEYRLRAGVSGPIAPKINGLVSFLHAQYDGNVENLFTGSDVNGYRRTGGRARFTYDPIAELHVSLALDYLDSYEDVPTGVFLRTSRIAYPTGAVTDSPLLAGSLARSGVTPGEDNTKVSQTFNSDVRDRNGGLALQGDYELGGGYTITSITGYRRWENRQHQDFDQISENIVGLVQGDDHGVVDSDQVSQEVRIASPTGRFLEYVAGLYYLDATTDERYQRDVSIVAPPPVLTTGVAYYGVDAQNYAIFGEATLNFTDDFRGIVGYRSIWDDLEYYHHRTANTAVNVTGVRTGHDSAGSTSERGDAYRLGLQYDLSDDVNVYATYSAGYKGPAFNVYFNMWEIDELALEPETSDAFEIGLKGRFLDGKVQAALAAYDTEFDNYQANFTDFVGGAPVTRLINAGSVSSRGVEGDFDVRPIDDLRIGISVAYTDATVDDFRCPPGAPVSCDINGKPLPFAPEWKYHLDAEYTHPLGGDLELRAQTDFTWQDDVQYQLDQRPDTIQQAYGIWNASLGVADLGSGFQVRGLVKNILDQEYSSFLAGGTPAGVVRWVPRDHARYVGVILRQEF